MQSRVRYILAKQHPISGNVRRVLRMRRASQRLQHKKGSRGSGRLRYGLKVWVHGTVIVKWAGDVYAEGRSQQRSFRDVSASVL